MLLQDVSTYKQLKNDLTYTLQTKVDKLFNVWFTKNFISSHLKRSLSSYNSVPAKCYGLPKIYKPGTPLRIIVSFIDSPTYQLAKFVNNLSKSFSSKPALNVKDSFEFVKKI